MRALFVAALLSTAQPATATSLADCMQDRDALRAVLPEHGSGLFASIGVFENTWCAINIPGQPAPVAWQRHPDAGGFTIEMQYPAPFAGVKLPFEFSLLARYDAQDRAISLTELLLARNVHGAYRLTGRIGDVDLSTTETGRKSLEVMTLSAARLSISGDAGFLSNTVAGLVGADPEKARRDPAMAAQQQEALAEALSGGMSPFVFDVGSGDALASYLRGYPHAGGALTIDLPDTPPFPFFRIYRYAIFGEVPTGAVLAEELKGLVLSLRWFPAE